MALCRHLRMVYHYRTCENHEVSVVIRYSRAVSAAALWALSLALMGAGNLPATPTSAVTIYNPGDADVTGYAIAIEPGGQAWTLDGAGRSQNQLPSALTQAFFTDLTAAGPLGALAAQSCATAPSKPGIYLVWHGQHSPNLRCASDPRADQLLSDATTIAHALYVQAYRVRPVGLQGGSATGYQSSYQSYQPSAPAGSGYAGGGGGFSGGDYGGGGYANSTFGGSAFPTFNGQGFASAGGTGLANITSSSPSNGFSLGGNFSSNLSTGNISSSLSTSYFSSGLPVNNSMLSGSLPSNGFSNGGLNNSMFSSGAFNTGAYRSTGTFSNQPSSGSIGSSSPSSGFSFH
jgi:hypothetical protein